MRSRSFIFLAVIITLSFCARREASPERAAPVLLPNAPKQTEQIIKSAFPGAWPAREFGDSVIHFLTSKYGIAPGKMLLGVSTCVDDIIYTKNFHMHPEIKG